MLKHNLFKTPEEKLAYLQRYYEENRVVKFGNLNFDGDPVYEGEGTIDRDRPPRLLSGVWGYGGDSIAVWVNGNPYPATAVICLTEGRYTIEPWRFSKEVEAK